MSSMDDDTYETNFFQVSRMVAKGKDHLFWKRVWYPLQQIKYATTE